MLRLNDLRDSVVLRVDGGIRTGRDIVIAALLGAEEFGIGTASLIAMGCLMVRQCHSNTCPVGVCTQDERLRARFTGSADKVVNLFSLIAQDVREILASLGVRTLDEIIGRTDLLRQVRRGAEHLDDLDLNPLLVRVGEGRGRPYADKARRHEPPDALDAVVLKEAAALFDHGRRTELSYAVANTHRSVGARLSSALVRRWGPAGPGPDQLVVRLTGVAGQSFGAFGAAGLTLELNGEANDYVAKGLSGADVVVRPARWSEGQPLIGNTALYGATSGQLFVAGAAGERFAVRNSGAVAVVEGAGAHACEYMTGGTVVILGPAGWNLAAGMSGGELFMLDEAGRTERLLNGDMAHVTVIDPEAAARLKRLIDEHARRTASPLTARLAARWPEPLQTFVRIAPRSAMPLPKRTIRIDVAAH